MRRLDAIASEQYCKRALRHIRNCSRKTDQHATLYYVACMTMERGNLKAVPLLSAWGSIPASSSTEVISPWNSKPKGRIAEKKKGQGQ